MTAQVSEKIIIEGKESRLNFCPPIPDSPEVITKLSEEEFGKAIMAGKIEGIFSSTACWRGYVGTWEIRDGKFYLNKLRGRIRLAQENPVHATWFTGVLRIPQGKILQYVHMGFGTLYEREVHIKVEAGVVTKQRTIDNAEKNRNMTDDERLMAGFNNMPGMENHFDGDDW